MNRHSSGFTVAHFSSTATLPICLSVLGRQFILRLTCARLSAKESALSSLDTS